jgi:hypothetical protein
MRMNIKKTFMKLREHVKQVRFYSTNCSFAAFLIFACEESVNGEDDSVDDGEGALSDAERLSVVVDEADEFSGGRFVPELDDQNADDDEENASDDRVEEIDSLVDRRVDDEAGEDSNQDDREADKGSVYQHRGMVVVNFGGGVVVERQTCQCNDQLQEFKD